MLLTYIFMQSAQAFDWQAHSERSRSKRLEFGVCAGISSECLFPSLKVGGVYEYFGISVSVAPAYYASTLSFRFYPKIDFPVRPYVYGGFAGLITFGGGAILPSGGVGADIHLGPLVLQPSVDIGINGTAGALSFLLKI